MPPSFPTRRSSDLPFLKRGFTPDSGATWLLPRLIGVARAKELLMLGRPISGADAAAWGMVHRAVPDEELGAAVDALRSEEHTSELQSLMRISYAVFCLKNKKNIQ